MASLGRQINRAKKRAAVANIKKIREIQAAQAQAAIDSAKGGLFGKIGGTLLSIALSSTLGPVGTALATGISSAAGQYYGGIKGAKKTDKLREALMAKPTWGYGAAGLARTATDMGDQTDYLRDSSIQTGITDAASSFMLSKGGDMLKKMGDKARLSESAKVAEMAQKIADGAPDAGNVTDIVKHLDKAYNFQNISGGEYAARALGWAPKGVKAQKSLIDKYEADLKRLQGG